MFIKRSEYEAMERRIKELEAKLEAERNDYLMKHMKDSIRISELLIEKSELQLREIKMQEYMEDYLYDMKEKAEFIYDELLSKDAYIAELEEALEEYEAAPEEVVVEAEYTVVEEPLLLMAPAETVKTTITTTVMTTITTEKSDGSITTETITTTKKEVIDSRIKKALRGFKGNVSERRTPPLPPHRRKAC